MKSTLLYAPEWYWNIPKEEREKGRCGPGNGIGEKLVPDNLIGLCITPACRIHDKMYQRGVTIEDKKEADRVFLNNMLRLIEKKSTWILKKPRKALAIIYYLAVHLFGGPAFWNNKNKINEWGLA